MAKKYYNLVLGDYIQSGDEYFDIEHRRWFLISKDFFGKRYGYGLNNSNETVGWARCRREVHESFGNKTSEVIIEEQWGSEFEV